VAPAKACECHSHIFGPEAKYPVAPGDGRNRHGEVSVDQYNDLLGRLGIERGVIVQPATYGADNRCTLDAIAERGLGRTRGIAVCTPNVSTDELRRLDRAGIRGIRVASPAIDMSFDEAATLAPRLADIGWHIQMSGSDSLPWLAARGPLPVPVVIDHMARLPKNLDLNAEPFTTLLRLLETGNVWIKLSGPYYGSAAGAPYADVIPRIAAMARHRPDRLVWALNWPHPSIAMDRKPDAADCLDVLESAVPDASTRKLILADNPARLYRFDD
jgi:D-galactarolactone isomerase